MSAALRLPLQVAFDTATLLVLILCIAFIERTERRLLGADARLLGVPIAWLVQLAHLSALGAWTVRCVIAAALVAIERCGVA